MNLKKISLFMPFVFIFSSTSAVSQTDWMGFTHDKPTAFKSLQSLDVIESDVGADTSCLSADGDVVLQADVPCIDVSGTANIDLNGYTVNGDVLSFGSDFTIKNGLIDGGSINATFGDVVIDNITLQNSTSNFGVQIATGQITNSRFESNGVAIDLFFGGGIEVENNYFSENRLAINIAQDSFSVVKNNVFVENDIGVRLFDEDFFGVNGNLISGNSFLRNDVGVFMRAFNAANDNEISNNTFISNKSSGIVAGIGCFRQFTSECAGRGTIINQNFVFRDGQDPRNVSGVWSVITQDGDFVDEPYDFLADAGITVFGAQIFNTIDDVSMSRNRVFLNSGLGIDADGVVDGGGNRGFLNGDSRQCTGVSC